MTECQHEWVVEKEAGDLAESQCSRCGETRDRRGDHWWSIHGPTVGLVLIVAAVAYASERPELAPLVTTASLLILIAILGLFLWLVGWRWVVNQVTWAWGPVVLLFYLFGRRWGILVAATWLAIAHQRWRHR
jgi:hypothetical protein